MNIITDSSLGVIVVEEDEYFILHLTTLIENIGYSVLQVVRDQAEALSAISSYRPDLVVMGLDTSEKKTLFKYAKVLKDSTPPILFITNFNKQTLYSKQSIGVRATEDTIKKAIKKTLTTLEATERVGNNVFIYKGFLFFAKKGIFDKIRIADVLYFKAIDDYALIYTAEKTVTIFIGLKELKVLLNDHLFVQIHRSHFINAQKNITSDLENNNLYIEEAYIVPMSRRLKKEIFGWFKSNNISVLPQF
ncbi:MAG: LytR/AlgR family response regulator transcription factor [Saprospiraceae bacterium]